MLTMDTSGMFNAANQLIDDDGDLVDGNTTNDDPTPTANPISSADVTLTWHRDGMPIMRDDDTNDQTDDVPNTETMYTLTDDDVAETITLVATYLVTTE